jgi:hypothetical protein
VVKAYYPLACCSASSFAGPFTIEPAANTVTTVPVVGVDCSPTVVGEMVTGGTFTVPISGAARFYRLDSVRPTRITEFRKTGSNVVITYQVL